MLDAVLRLARYDSRPHRSAQPLSFQCCTPDIDTWLAANVFEANILHYFTKLEIPLPSSLLEAIERLEEHATSKRPS